MGEIAVYIFIALMLLLVWRLTDSDSGFTYPREHCEDNPNKKCPYRYRVNYYGSRSVDTESLVACCKFKKQCDAFQRLADIQRKKNGG